MSSSVSPSKLHLGSWTLQGPARSSSNSKWTLPRLHLSTPILLSLSQNNVLKSRIVTPHSPKPISQPPEGPCLPARPTLLALLPSPTAHPKAATTSPSPAAWKRSLSRPLKASPSPTTTSRSLAASQTLRSSSTTIGPKITLLPTNNLLQPLPALGSMPPTRPQVRFLQ